MHRTTRVLGTMLAAIVLGIAPSCARSEDGPSHPESPTVTVPSFRGTMVQLAAVLQKGGVPISIIQAVGDPQFELDEKRIAVRRLLEKVESLTGVYRLEWIDGHAVLYPKALPYDREIRNVAIIGERRFEAAAGYLRLVRGAVPEIPLIVGPGQLRAGAPGEIPLYDDPVTLKPNARVIDHLVQLLGSDNRLFFVIKEHSGLKRPAGAMIIYFGSVERQ